MLDSLRAENYIFYLFSAHSPSLRGAWEGDTLPTHLCWMKENNFLQMFPIFMLLCYWWCFFFTTKLKPRDREEAGKDNGDSDDDRDHEDHKITTLHHILNTHTFLLVLGSRTFVGSYRQLNENETTRNTRHNILMPAYSSILLMSKGSRVKNPW